MTTVADHLCALILEKLNEIPDDILSKNVKTIRLGVSGAEPARLEKDPVRKYLAREDVRAQINEIMKDCDHSLPLDLAFSDSLAILTPHVFFYKKSSSWFFIKWIWGESPSTKMEMTLYPCSTCACVQVSTATDFPSS